MTRLMYDSTSAADIPAGAQLVGGYVDGFYAWSPADWARFAGAVLVRIATQPGTDDGEVLDVEPGNASPAAAPPWVRARRAAGVDPTVYCSLDSWPQLRSAFAAQGVAEPHWWLARWDGSAVMIDGAVAVQYANPTYTGAHYDLSIVADHWPGVDPGPPLRRKRMLLLDHGDGTMWLLAPPFYVSLGPKDGNAAVNALVAIGTPTSPLGADTHAALVTQAEAHMAAAGAPHSAQLTGSLTFG